LFSAYRQPPGISKTSVGRLLLIGATLLCFSLALQAAPTPTDTSSAKKDIEAQARAAQTSGNWLQAVRLYDELLHSRDKSSADVREAYQECLRRYFLQRRQNDRLYRDAVAKLDRDQALALLDQILETVSKSYFDRSKTEPAVLAKYGLQELSYALDEELFTKQNLTTTDRTVIDALRAKLNELKERKVTTIKQAHDLVCRFAGDAKQLGAVADAHRAVAVFAMEFACGACNALDEYSLYLTPFHLNALRGRYVGVGVDLAIIDQKLVISRVYPNSPAMESGQLAVGDRVRKIDSLPAENLPPDVVAERLLGEPDTIIELEVVRGEMELKPVRLVRRAVATPSVYYFSGGGPNSSYDDIGVIRIYNFQEGTAKEVQEAIAELLTDRSPEGKPAIKGLILDLRGNPGGLFKAAVQVSELFLGEGGVIVFTQGQLKEFNRPYKVESSNPFQLPMVVLVDGDTASSAEILAAALKEHERAKLFGQPTFGKGTVQQVFPLDRSGGGIRITVAKFTSPLKHPVSATGVIPNVLVDETDGRETYNRALKEMLLLLGRMPMEMPPS
jgi:carboxyl-terminal processing protease